MLQPIQVNLEAEKEYYYCTCGKSKSSVLCDGSHKGSEFSPMVFSVKESKNYHLCSCKKSANAPFCDGSHTK